MAILTIPEQFERAFIAAANAANDFPDDLDLSVDAARERIYLSNNFPDIAPACVLPPARERRSPSKSAPSRTFAPMSKVANGSTSTVSKRLSPLIFPTSTWQPRPRSNIGSPPSDWLAAQCGETAFDVRRWHVPASWWSTVRRPGPSGKFLVWPRRLSRCRSVPALSTQSRRHPRDVAHARREQ